MFVHDQDKHIDHILCILMRIVVSFREDDNDFLTQLCRQSGKLLKVHCIFLISLVITLHQLQIHVLVDMVNVFLPDLEVLL